MQLRQARHCSNEWVDMYLFLPSARTLIQGLCHLSSVLYLEGSVLVFEDIFRLIAFYCVSR